ncbi:MAG: hypothetical protein QM635_08445 [Microbacteriaceae bacterium]
MDDRHEHLVSLTNALPGRDGEFQDWYWGRHIPEILALPGFVGARCLRLEGEPGPIAPYRYATIYEIDGSAERARALLFTSDLGSSDALDTSQMIMAPFELAQELPARR